MCFLSRRVIQGEAELLITLGLQTSNKFITQGVDPSKTVEDLKKMISAVESIPDDESLRLIYNGKELKNKDVLSAVGIKAGATAQRCLLIWENSEKVLKAKK